MTKETIVKEATDIINIWIENELKDSFKYKEKFEKANSASDMLAFIEWKTEGVAKTEIKMDYLVGLLNHVKGDGIEGLKKFKKELTRQMITQPYRHSSTSLMANALVEWKKQVISSFLCPLSGNIQSLENRIEKLMWELNHEC